MSKFIKVNLTPEQLEEVGILFNAWENKSVKISQADFGHKYDLGGQAMVSQFLQGSRVLNLKAALAFCKELNLNLAELSPRLLKELESYKNWDINTTPVENYGKVPVISWVAAGNFCATGDIPVLGDPDIEWLHCPVPHSDKTYGLRIKGLSMFNPDSDVSFNEGEVVFIDPEKEYRHKSFVTARKEGDSEVTFKRLLIDNGKMYLEALNPSWPNRIIEIDDAITICGVAITKVTVF